VQTLNLSGGSSSHCPSNPQIFPTLSCGDSLSTSDYNKSFIPPLSIIVPQQGSTNSEDCPKALLCTECEVFEIIFGLECTKIYWT